MVTALFQLAIELASGSVALLGDTIHNVADATTSIPLWVAFLLGWRAHSRTYPNGYRRAEDLADIFIMLMIAAFAMWIGWESVARLLDPAVGLLITGLILWLLKPTSMQVVRRPMDAVERDTLAGIEQAARLVEGVRDVGTVRARWSGHRLLDAHHLSEQVRHRLLHDIDHLEDAWIHVNPTTHADLDPHALTVHHRGPIDPSCREP